jgi:hypothetical protein
MRVEDELKKLVALRDSGALTQEEFDLQRMILVTRASATVDAAARPRGPITRRDQWHENIGLVLFAGMAMAFLSGAIVLVIAFLWQGHELSLRSILLAWPIAAVVLSVTFAPLAILADRREGTLPDGSPRAGSSPFKATSEAAQMAPFGLAVGATVLAILILWTSILHD